MPILRASAPDFQPVYREPSDADRREWAESNADWHDVDADPPTIDPLVEPKTTPLSPNQPTVDLSGNSKVVPGTPPYGSTVATVSLMSPRSPGNQNV